MIIPGGAWNVSNPDRLCVTDRGRNSLRGRLGDCGFRCVLVLEDFEFRAMIRHIQWRVRLAFAVLFPKPR